MNDRDRDESGGSGGGGDGGGSGADGGRIAAPGQQWRQVMASSGSAHPLQVFREECVSPPMLFSSSPLRLLASARFAPLVVLTKARKTIHTPSRTQVRWQVFVCVLQFTIFVLLQLPPPCRFTTLGLLDPADDELTTREKCVMLRRWKSIAGGCWRSSFSLTHPSIPFPFPFLLARHFLVHPPTHAFMCARTRTHARTHSLVSRLGLTRK